MTQADHNTTYESLRGHTFMNLTTFRKTGQPVITPVWFAQEGTRLYVMTLNTAGKVKRIRHTAQVEVAPSDRRGNALGGAIRGMARVLPDDEVPHANQALTAKYGLMKRVFDFVFKLRRLKQAFLEVTPEHHESDRDYSA